MDRPTSEALPQEAALSHSEIRSIIFGILLAMLLAALDQTIVATAMPTIGRELGDFGNLSWVVTAYLLASTVVTPLYGKFSDIHGRRVSLLIGIATFVAGSIACALAPSMIALVLARGLQGLGGGGLISLAQTIIADIVSPKERGRYQVYIASVFVTSSLLGPVLGGFFAEHLHWSVIFWINVPLGLFALWTTNASLKRLPHYNRPRRLDLLGALLMAGATVTFMLALTWGGNRIAWASGPLIALLAGSGLLWTLFGLRIRLAPEPLIPLTVLSNPVVLTATLAACFGMGTFIGLTIYMPVYFESVIGLGASQSGLALIPLMVGTVAGATVSGRAMASLTHYKRVPVVGLAVAIAGTASLAAWPQGLPLLAIEATLAAISLGLGTLLPVSTVAIQNAVEREQLGTATATANFFRALGGAVIVAVFGAVIAGGGAGEGGSGLRLDHLDPAAAASLARLFRWVFLAAAAGFALALAFLGAMEERPLRGRAVRATETAPD